MALVTVLLFAGRAQADVWNDGWLVAEAPAALAMSDAQDGVFRPGMMPAFGAYAERGHVALGLRMRAGVLRNGPAPGGNYADPGLGGLATGGLALRLGAGGGWAELVGGGGVTGGDVVPAVEAGVGWSFAVGSVDVGPSARYVRVVSPDRMATFGTAELALIGVDVRFGRARAQRRVLAPAHAEPAVEVAAVEPVEDRAIDRESGCVEELDGCPLADAIVIENNRIVLDERVLFDFNRARVRSHGREVIGELMRIWRSHPEWVRMTIEGHADARGSDTYNQQLSELRAQRVRHVMLELGATEDQLDAVGFGRSRPRDTSNTEAGHSRNRRVEFAIETREELAHSGDQP
ncbi:MAG TPA: OmpA family protein [Kofleriaceae bacterium]|nr:OmpA family protein [Kofleriaceae bacterium]